MIIVLFVEKNREKQVAINAKKVIDKVFTSRFIEIILVKLT